MSNEQKIIAITYTNTEDAHKLRFLTASAEANLFKIVYVGIGETFSWLGRLKAVLAYLEKMPADKNPVICFTDGYDVFYTTNTQEILRKFLTFNADIVWSTERWYAHQLEEYKDFYIKLAPQGSRYCFLNGGGYVGYKNAIIDLISDVIRDDVIDKSKGNDQTWIAGYLASNFEKYNIKLDYSCDIFYTNSGDSMTTNHIEKFFDEDLMLRSTNTKPAVIHVSWIAKFAHILEALFYKKYPFKKSSMTNW